MFKKIRIQLRFLWNILRFAYNQELDETQAVEVTATWPLLNPAG
jgi:hypothetical protein